MRVNFKAIPLSAPHPALPGQQHQWWPILNVVLFYKHKRTPPIEAVVDSGSQTCLFHAAFGRLLGIDIESGVEGPLGGVIGGAMGKVYYHKVRLLAAGETYEIAAGFSHQLSCAGLLGQVGFFDHFITTFDYTPDPPCFEVTRIRAN